jgi:hypothetical protein
MEALWNYFYWQTLTTNALDDVGHVLRLSVIVNECSPYSTNPSPALLEECNEFLGPTQPGVTTPDPTETSEAASATASTTARRRPRGQGQTHGSDPNTGRRPAPRAVVDQRPARDGLLDFLLAE